MIGCPTNTDTAQPLNSLIRSLKLVEVAVFVSSDICAIAAVKSCASRVCNQFGPDRVCVKIRGKNLQAIVEFSPLAVAEVEPHVAARGQLKEERSRMQE